MIAAVVWMDVVRSSKLNTGTVSAVLRMIELLLWLVLIPKIDYDMD